VNQQKGKLTTKQVRPPQILCSIFLHIKRWRVLVTSIHLFFLQQEFFYFLLSALWALMRYFAQGIQIFRLSATVGLARAIKPGRMRSIRSQATPKTWKSQGAFGGWKEKVHARIFHVMQHSLRKYSGCLPAQKSRDGRRQARNQGGQPGNCQPPKIFKNIFKVPKKFLVVRWNNKLQTFATSKISAGCSPGRRWPLVTFRRKYKGEVSWNFFELSFVEILNCFYCRLAVS